MKTKIFSILMVLMMAAIPGSVFAAPSITMTMTPSSSTIIRSTLVDVSSGVEATYHSLVEAAIVGVTPFTITFTNTEPATPIWRNMTGTDVNLQLWVDYGGVWYNINNPGWNSYIAPNTTISVYAIADHVYTYTVVMDLALTSGGATIATASEVINVMEATTLTADVVLPTILFSVDKTQLDFGTVIVGRTSDPQVFRITNNGNLDIAVEAVVTGSLYINHMQLQQDGAYAKADGWISPMIAAEGGYLDVNARLFEPSAAYAGTNIPGTLTFIASEY